MSDQSSLSDVLAIIAASDALPVPSVEPVRSVIRSGDTFLLGGQTQQSPGQQPADTKPVHLGSLIIEWGYDVEPHRAPQFHRWLLDNEAALRDGTPPGCRYLGTYGVFSQDHPERGAYRTVWVYDGPAALTVLNECMADSGSSFARLVAELNEFRDRRIGAGRSQAILQPAVITRRL